MEGEGSRSQLEQERATLELQKRARESSVVTGRYDASFWARLFAATLEQERHAQADDMVFYATAAIPAGSAEEEDFKIFTDVGGFFVRRRGASGASMPRLGSPSVDWEATFYLNALCNGIEFRLIVTGRTSEAPGAVGEKVATRVFASPHLVPAADAKTEQQSSFPLLTFQVHDYWNVGSVAVACSGDGGRAQLLGVELLAKGTLLGRGVKAVVFAGALSGAQIEDGFVRQRRNDWAWTRRGETHVPLKGPGGRGEASLVVTPGGEAAEREAERSKGWLGWLKPPPPPQVFKCMVSHVSIHYRDIVAKQLRDK
jgi:hypothetical protein